MSEISVVVYSDYVCPWCYMMHASLEQVVKETPLDIEWRAYELQPEEAGIDEAALAEKQKQIDSFWPQVDRTAKEVYGLELKKGRLGVNTRLAHMGAKAARRLGRGDEYHRKVFETHWHEQRDISDPEILVAIARDVGLDEDAFRESLADDELRAEVLGEQIGAQQVGIRGVPALIIDNRYLISGAQPPERLIAVFQEYQQRGELG